jgi:membrane-bound lytic murein transglycosylase B
MRCHSLYIILFFLFNSSVAFCELNFDKPMSENPEVIVFVKSLAANLNVEFTELILPFHNSYFDKSVLDLIEKPAETTFWQAYSSNVISKERINKGREYLTTHFETLKAAEFIYGVPPKIITAVIGIESSYGTVQFKRTAFVSLSTLAFGYERRSKFFKNELVSFITTSIAANRDPLSYKSSYAGAIGIPQFMPGNIAKYAVDGDNDSVVDIEDNHKDAIFSVANYIKSFGWKEGEFTSLIVEVDNNIDNSTVALYPCSDKNKSAADWKKLGVVMDASVPDSAKAVLSRLDEDNGDYTYILFFHNACPLHRYNSSLKYVAAVSTLADSY